MKAGLKKLVVIILLITFLTNYIYPVSYAVSNKKIASSLSERRQQNLSAIEESRNNTIDQSRI